MPIVLSYHTRNSFLCILFGNHRHDHPWSLCTLQHFHKQFGHIRWHLSGWLIKDLWTKLMTVISSLTKFTHATSPAMQTMTNKRVPNIRTVTIPIAGVWITSCIFYNTWSRDRKNYSIQFITWIAQLPFPVTLAGAHKIAKPVNALTTIETWIACTFIGIFKWTTQHTTS